jgi:K+-sensing histidine kinase KdpD
LGVGKRLGARRFLQGTGREKLGAPDQSEATMDRFRTYRDQIAFAAALVLPLGVAVLLVPFRGDFATTASALILVAVIVAVAALGNRFSGLVATVGATLWFDVFLTQPYERLAITHRPDIETAVCLFVVGIIVTELAARNRHHYASAAEEADYVGLIYEVSELVASGKPAAEVREKVNSALVDLLHLRACRYEPTQDPNARPMMRLEHDGHVLLGGRVWGVDRMGLPGPEIELLVQRWGQVLGRFVLTPTPGYEVPLEPRVVAVALADQVGASLRPHLRSA